MVEQEGCGPGEQGSCGLGTRNKQVNNGHVDMLGGKASLPLLVITMLMQEVQHVIQRSPDLWGVMGLLGWR